MTYLTNSQTSYGEETKLLEFYLLLGRVLKKKNRVYHVDSTDFNFTINAKGDKFKGEVFFKPLDTSELFATDIVIKEGSDRFTGGFRPFIVIQEEVGDNDVSLCEGSDAERTLLLFLSQNLQFTDLLDVSTSKRLSKLLKGFIKDQDEYSD